MKWSLAVCGVVLWGWACSSPVVSGEPEPSTQPPEPSATLCDGSAGLRLGMMVLPEPARTPPGQQVMWDNGAHFLYVDGQCRYHASWGRLWAETRAGVLTEEQARQLVSDVRYAEWPRWAGQWWPQSSVSDASPFVFYAGPEAADTIVCHRLCEGAPVPEGLQDMARRYRDSIQRLYERGTPVDGPVRYAVVRVEPGSHEGVPHFEWPLADVDVDVAAVALTELDAAALGYGPGRLAEGADAEALRALRRQYVESQVSLNTFHLPVVDGAGNRYRLYLRDTVPLEDAQGLIRPR